MARLKRIILLPGIATAVSLLALASSGMAQRRPGKHPVPKPPARALGPVGAVGSLGQFTLDGRPAVAVGYPLAEHGRGEMQLTVDVRAKRAGKPAGRTISFVGERPGDHLGASLAGGADVNGDGFPDVIMGAPDASPDGRRRAGEVWVFFGTPDPGAFPLSLMSDYQGYEIIGAHAGDRLGAAVAIDRDFDGDGHSDLILGAPGADGGTGVVYGIRGELKSPTIDLAKLTGSQGFAIAGAPRGGHFGAAVAPGGYQDNSAYAGILAGAPDAYGGRGAAYVVYAPQPGASRVRLGSRGQGYKIVGGRPGDHAGAGVAAIGDINHDGYTDVAVGAPGAAYSGRGHPGVVAIILGGKRTRTIDLGGYSPGFIIGGVHDGDQTGAALAGGDGSVKAVPALLIGAPGASFSRAGAGAAYALVGKAIRGSDNLYRDLLGRSYRLDGRATDDHVGSSLAEFIGGPIGSMIVGSSGAGAGAWLAFPP
jgi:hypothetical protein